MFWPLIVTTYRQGITCMSNVFHNNRSQGERNLPQAVVFFFVLVIIVKRSNSSGLLNLCYKIQPRCSV